MPSSAYEVAMPNPPETAFIPLLSRPSLLVNLSPGRDAAVIGRNVDTDRDCGIRIRSSNPAVAVPVSGTALLPPRGVAAVSLTAGSDGVADIVVESMAHSHALAALRVRVHAGAIVEESGQ